MANVDHEKAPAVEPPDAAPTAAYGEHLVQVCRGCHGANLSGGAAEMKAIWAYLRTVPTVEKGKR